MEADLQDQAAGLIKSMNYLIAKMDKLPASEANSNKAKTLLSVFSITKEKLDSYAKHQGENAAKLARKLEEHKQKHDELQAGIKQNDLKSTRLEEWEKRLRRQEEEVQQNQKIKEELDQRSKALDLLHARLATENEGLAKKAAALKKEGEDLSEKDHRMFLTEQDLVQRQTLLEEREQGLSDERGELKILTNKTQAQERRLQLLIEQNDAAKEDLKTKLAEAATKNADIETSNRKLEADKAEFAAHKQAQVDAISKLVEGNIATVKQTLDTYLAGQIPKMDSIIEAFADLKRSFTSKLEADKAEFTAQQQQREAAISKLFDGNTGAINQALDDHLDSIVGALTDLKRSFTLKLETDKAELAAQNQAQVASLSKSVEGNLTTIKQTFSDHFTGQVPKLDSIVEALADLKFSSTSKSETERELAAELGSQNKRLQEQQAELAFRAASEESLTSQRNDLAKSVKDLESQLEQATARARLVEGLEAECSKLKPQLAAAKARARLVEGLETECNKLKSQLEDAGARAQLVEGLESESEKLKSQLEDAGARARRVEALETECVELYSQLEKANARARLVEGLENECVELHSQLEEANARARRVEALETECLELKLKLENAYARARLVEALETECNKLKLGTSRLQEELAQVGKIHAAECQAHQRVEMENKNLKKELLTLQENAQSITKFDATLTAVKDKILDTLGSVCHGHDDLIREQQLLQSRLEGYNELVDIHSLCEQEISTLVSEMTELKEQLKDARENTLLLEGALGDQLRNENHELKQKLDDAQTLADETKETLLKAQRQLESRLEEANVIASACKGHDRLAETNSTLVQQTIDLQKRVHELQQELNQVTKESSDLQRQLKEEQELSSTCVRDGHAELTRKNAHLMSEKDKLQIELISAQSVALKCHGHETLAQDKSALEQKLADMQPEYARLKKAASDCQCQRLEQELASARELASAGEQSRKRRRADDESNESPWEKVIAKVSTDMRDIVPVEVGPKKPGPEKLFYELSGISLEDAWRQNWETFVSSPTSKDWHCTQMIMSAGHDGAAILDDGRCKTHEDGECLRVKLQPMRQGEKPRTIFTLYEDRYE
ncbi:hypothetical protein QBC42DRAFT_256848 [Cladorrhinum samala]|uniref:Uncharacterized protein n=1 Tax=Cladorrhinum samala TaxID=585594 RepID=A0AAV9H816_9PEZI|nr:hypothetical protein QBC42DRAFT_256848 [Cladorrhinum samala]